MLGNVCSMDGEALILMPSRVLSKTLEHFQHQSVGINKNHRERSLHGKEAFGRNENLRKYAKTVKGSMLYPSG